MPVREQEFSADDPLARHLETRSASRGRDPETPFRSRAKPHLRERAESVHEERSGAARTADAQFNAPIAPDYQTWRRSPNRYDIPGVDTIPSAVMKRRSASFIERLQEAGAIERMEEQDPEEMGSTKASFLASERRIQVRSDLEDDASFPTEARAFTLAHEGGHAFDRAVGEREDLRFQQLGWSLVGKHHMDKFTEEARWDVDEELGESFVTLSERARGEIEDLLKPYRGRVGELFADAVALSVLEPRAARREAPKAFDAIQREGFAHLEDAL